MCVGGGGGGGGLGVWGVGMEMACDFTSFSHISAVGG